MRYHPNPVTRSPWNERPHEWAGDCHDDLKMVRDLRAHLTEPFIMNASTLDNHLFTFSQYYDRQYQLNHAIQQWCEAQTGLTNLWKMAEEICVEDVAWTQWRNRDLTGTFFHKYTLKSAYVAPLTAQLDQWEAQLAAAAAAWEAWQVQETDARERDQAEYQVVATHTLQMPKGGEDGADGYADLTLVHTATHQPYRLIARNVFDFGFYTYPQRLEGQDAMFDRTQWTDDEQAACQWLGRWSPLTTTIRMSF